jgi:mono/diheme cytochrome c family protein
MSLARSFVLLGTAVVAAGCGFPKSAAAPGPVTPAETSAATARWPDATQASLEQGRSLFLAHCNACHSYPDVTAVPDERWPGILDKMGQNAKLDAEQTKLVLRFIQAARAGGS